MMRSPYEYAELAEEALENAASTAVADQTQQHLYVTLKSELPSGRRISPRGAPRSLMWDEARSPKLQHIRGTPKRVRRGRAPK
jgi:hypothetical protein